ncbi:DUF1674 domain-containing protein [Pedomonas sp. V897]|uniref:DUF1674 domain-containing protein n=1 Tax=Pedomonas sp. V897 TaxID=3446482 RepID=UPI003EE2067F
MTDKPREQETTPPRPDGSEASEAKPEAVLPREIGGRKGPEPTRYGDWEKGGICTDF